MSNANLKSFASLQLSYGGRVVTTVDLQPSHSVNIGRSSDNRIVIPDELCSRHHAVVFPKEGQWWIRDLGSRNGLAISGNRIKEDSQLKAGDTVEIGNWKITFLVEAGTGDPRTPPAESYTILERKTGTRYDGPPKTTATATAGSFGLAQLYHLARMMASATSISELCQQVLTAVLPRSSADIGAILLLPVSLDRKPTPADLIVTAIQSTNGMNYARVSDYLSGTVLNNHEAILARDISSDPLLATRDSLGHLSARSVICAPIRRNGSLLGLLHLYSSDPDRPLDTDELEFALAVADQLSMSIEGIRDREQLQDGLSRASVENSDLRKLLEVESELVGHSPAMGRLREAIGKVAPTSATVLIRGESGVGKELVARALHFNSTRRSHPFVCVNCAALAESVLESELFGHEKGAFTGALNRRMGRFEQADQGTLFLDEIGEMSPELQAKFLRVLEGHPFERVGGTKPIRADVRIVTATNRDLEKAVQEGTFRQDLYFRLHVVEIVVPPLRQRPEDIVELARYFLRKYSKSARMRILDFSQETVAKLKSYRWPGNVRELKNAIERAVILAERPILQPEDIQVSRFSATTSETEEMKSEGEVPFTLKDTVPEGFRIPEAVVETREASSPVAGVEKAAANEAAPAGPVDIYQALRNVDINLDQLESAFIQATLERCEGNKSLAARRLGIERTTLDRKISRFGLKVPGS